MVHVLVRDQNGSQLELLRGRRLGERAVPDGACVRNFMICECRKLVGDDGERCGGARRQMRVHTARQHVFVCVSSPNAVGAAAERNLKMSSVLTAFLKILSPTLVRGLTVRLILEKGMEDGLWVSWIHERRAPCSLTNQDVRVVVRQKRDRQDAEILATRDMHIVLTHERVGPKALLSATFQLSIVNDLTEPRLGVEVIENAEDDRLQRGQPMTKCEEHHRQREN